jgi:hypothetical protein
VHHGRSHLVAYRGGEPDPLDRVRGAVLRRAGPTLHRARPWVDALGVTRPWRRAREAVGRVARSTR